MHFGRAKRATKPPRPGISFEGGASVSAEKQAANRRTLRNVSLDTWAVVIALLAALLIRAGIVKHIPW